MLIFIYFLRMFTGPMAGNNSTFFFVMKEGSQNICLSLHQWFRWMWYLYIRIRYRKFNSYYTCHSAWVLYLKYCETHRLFIFCFYGWIPIFSFLLFMIQISHLWVQYIQLKNKTHSHSTQIFQFTVKALRCKKRVI